MKSIDGNFSIFYDRFQKGYYALLTTGTSLYPPQSTPEMALQRAWEHFSKPDGVWVGKRKYKWNGLCFTLTLSNSEFQTWDQNLEYLKIE